MNEARNYRWQETLKNAAEVTIRAVRPDERVRIVARPETRERKAVAGVFGRPDVFSAADLPQIAATEFIGQVMLLATMQTAQGEMVIGSGSYSTCTASDGWPAANVAFAVATDFQGIGIASRVLSHLTRVARDQGIAQFDAKVLSDNRPMLGVFARSQLPMRRCTIGDVVQVSLMLTFGRQANFQPSSATTGLESVHEERPGSIKLLVAARGP